MDFHNKSAHIEYTNVLNNVDKDNKEMRILLLQ